jgi:hypothetical protein
MKGNQPRLGSTSLFIGLKMPNRPNRPRNFSQAAKLVIDIVTRQVEASEDEFMFAKREATCAKVRLCDVSWYRPFVR